MAGSVQSCVIQVNNIQRMIDINASNLEGLRTQCTATSDLIQQEIKDQETKLVKLFSRMLMARQKIEAECTNHLDYHQYPRLKQWLHVVGIGSGGIKVILEKYGSFGSLLAAEEDNIRGALRSSSTGLEDARKLIVALNKLREVTEQRRSGTKSSSSIPLNSTSSSSDSAVLINGDSSVATNADRNGPSRGGKPKQAPPPLAKIKRSKSDELATKPRLDAICLSPGGSLGKSAGRRLRVDIPFNSDSLERLVGERSNNRHSSSSNNSSSPKTPTRVNITEKHKFSTKQMMIPTPCYLCKKQLFRGVKCEECGLRFHKKCSKKSLSGCEFFREMAKLTLRNTRQYRSLPYRYAKFKGERTKSEPTVLANQIDNPGHEGLRSHTSHGELFHNGTQVYHRGLRKDTPPQFVLDPLIMSGVLADAVTTHSSTSTPQHSPPLPSGRVPASAPPQGMNELYDRQGITARSVRRRKGLAHFFFPDYDDNDDDDREDTDETIGRKDSVLSLGSSVTVNSNDSTISGGDAPNIDSLESQISDYDSLTRTWSSKRWERESHLSEWTIPFNEIELQVKIGVGRIGEVYRGNWHGQVAVKVIEIQQPTVTQLQAFKIQVQTFRKTRHENLVLFMGACMEPPKLAIITSLCKGHPLFNRIHIFNETLPFVKVMLILKQIAQGMSYLHSRGIIHADLKSKNIFFESNTKVVITDFGHLRLAAGLSVENTRPGRVRIPCGWLYYLAPEVISLLSPYRPLNKRMFTKESDVYAFGTVCYELLAGSWPFSDFPLETIIYQVGNGAKQSLTKLDVVREMKDVINYFWAFQPNRRPAFKNISKVLEKIPITKGRLYRSPSQPVTRTLEASF